MEITTRLDDDGELAFETPVGEVDRDGLEKIVHETAVLYFHHASGQPKGWCYRTFALRHGRSAPRIEDHDVQPVGPSTEDVDRDELPTAAETRKLVDDQFEHVYVDH